jgi:hypothetical protein
MRIRTVYFKVSGIEAAAEFWRAFLDMAPTKAFPECVMANGVAPSLSAGRSS